MKSFMVLGIVNSDQCWFDLYSLQKDYCDPTLYNICTQKCIGINHFKYVYYLMNYEKINLE